MKDKLPCYGKVDEARHKEMNENKSTEMQGSGKRRKTGKS
jgi:hypothetical protein